MTAAASAVNTEKISDIRTLQETASVIHYASTLPSTGKTFWAVRQLVQKIKKKTGITLYVAPTNLLLREVFDSIHKKLTVAQMEHVHLVSYEELRENNVIHHLDLLIGGGRDMKYGRLYAPAEPGTVILCTHEAFIGLNHGHTENDDGKVVYNLRRRGEVSVIFDEARKCAIENQKFHIPFSILTTLFQKYIRLENSYEGLQKDSDAKKYSRLLLINTRLDSNNYNNIFKATKATRSLGEKIRRLLDTLKDEGVRMYASVDLEEENDSGKTYAVMQTILVPYHVFSGWKTVILLSAFFENSQMYHLLKQQDVSNRGSNETKKSFRRRIMRASTQGIRARIILKNVTDQVVSAERVAAVKARYEKTSITYMSALTSFSQGHLSRGVMVSTKALQEFDFSEFFRTYRRLAEERQKQVGGTSLIPLKVLLHLMRTEKTESHDQSLINHVNTLPGLVKKYTPLQWYCLCAVRMSQIWQKKHGIKDIQPVPLTVNIGVRDLRNRGTQRYWLREVAKVLKSGIDAIEMPFVSHGLNSYSHLDTIGFLATLNPSPEVVGLFNQICPFYDAALDHTLDQCIQSAARCSLRDVKSISEPLIIVTDLPLAKRVQEQLFNLPKIVEPSFFGIPEKDPVFSTVDHTAKERVRKYRRLRNNPRHATSAFLEKNKAWLAFLYKHSHAARSYQYVTTRISFYKKQGKPYDELKTKLDSLKPARKADVKKYRPLFEQQYKPLEHS